MKKRIMIAFIIMLCVILLSGCTHLNENSVGKLSSVVSSIISDIMPEAEPQEFTSINIPNGWDVYNADMYNRDTVILLFGNDYSNEYQVAFYDTEAGISVIFYGEFHIEFDEMDFFSFTTLSIQPYVVADTVHEVVYRFSDDFSNVTEVSTYELGTYSYEYCPSRDSLIYSISSDSACELREYSFATGEDTVIKDFGRTYSYANLDYYYKDENIGIISAGELFTDEFVNVLFDFTDMSIIGQYDSTYTMYDGTDGLNMTWFADSATNISVAPVNIENKTVGQTHIIDMTDSVHSINVGDYMFVFEDNEGSKCDIKAFNIDTGLLEFESNFDFIDHVKIPISSNFDEMDPMTVYISTSENYCYSDGKLLFSLKTLDSDYVNALILWDTSIAEIKNEPLTLGKNIEYPIYEVAEPVYYSDSNTEYAESLERTYGIEIYYGDSADLEFMDFNAEMVYDEDAIYLGLTALEEALSMFPDGFFAEFSESGYIRGINFYLCGELSPYNEESISDPAAFTYTDSGFAMVVANVYEKHALVSHYCHEICHVIDNRLIAEEILDEEIWNSFNPDGFEYNNSYIGEDGNDYEESASDEYTTWDDDYISTWDTEYIYFIDSYSKTYPTEDRARVFEYAINSDDFSEEYFESSHLQAKLNYLSQCIRECWDSADWASVSWEKVLAS